MGDQEISFGYTWQDEDYPAYKAARAVYSARVFAGIMGSSRHKIGQYLMLLIPGVVAVLLLYLGERFLPQYGPDGTAVLMHSAYGTVFIYIVVATAIGAMGYAKFENSRDLAERALFDQIGSGPFQATIRAAELHIKTPALDMRAHSFVDLDFLLDDHALVVLHKTGMHLFPLRDLPEGRKTADQIKTLLMMPAV